MKTIKQIADEIGVSKQAVFYRMKRPPLSNELHSLVHNDGSTLMVMPDGEAMIKQAFVDNAVKNNTDKKTAKKKEDEVVFDGDILRLLQDNITLLQEQLSVKDHQIEELTATVRAQAESINADRRNELAGTIIDGQKMLHDGSGASAGAGAKPGVISRIWRAIKNEADQS